MTQVKLAHMIYFMNIHQRIRQRREQLVLSMQALAELIPVRAWQTIQQWEREGGTAPKRERLRAVARALQTSEKWLMFGDQDEKSAKGDKTRLGQKRLLTQEAPQEWPFSVSRHDIDRLPPNVKKRLDEFMRGFIEGVSSVKGDIEVSRRLEASLTTDPEAEARTETPDGKVTIHIPPMTRASAKKSG